MDAAELRDETSGLCTEGKCGEWVRSHWGMRRTTTGWTSLSQHKETMRRTDEVHCIHEFARRLLEAECGCAGDHHASVNHGCRRGYDLKNKCRILGCFYTLHADGCATEATMMRGRSLLLMGLTLEFYYHFDEDMFN